MLVAGLVASCADGATRAAVDAAMSADAGTVDDLATDTASPMDAGTVDAPTADRVDASVDARVDVRVDVPADRPDAQSPWGDVPLVNVGGFLLPIDPHAVPAPGSECTSDASVREGDPTIAPPRPLRPLSVSRVTSQRPTFHWALPEGTTGARVEVCEDRCCTRVIQRLDAEGTSTRPLTTLPPGVVFWRMFGRRAGQVGSRASYTWEFEVRHRDAPNDTSWGTVHDFTGDGVDDLIIVRPRRMDGRGPADLLLMSGSTEGLRTPAPTGIAIAHSTGQAEQGDFNGDGIADIAWDDRINEATSRAIRSWCSVMYGGRDEVRLQALPPVASLDARAVVAGTAVVDWNGDGYSDLIVHIGVGYLDFPARVGELFVGFNGSSSGLALVPQWAIRADAHLPDRLLGGTSGIGDLDGDGYGEVFTTSLSLFSGRMAAGLQAIFHGGPAGDARVDVLGPPDSSFVYSEWGSGRLWPVGDCDGDGFVDSVLSLNYTSPVYVFSGVIGLRIPASQLLDPLRGGYFGGWVSSGDNNGDGLADVVISSTTAAERYVGEFPVNAGRVYVYLGSPGGVIADPIRISRAILGDEENLSETFGNCMASPGDINRDGIDDIIMSDTVMGRLCVRNGSVGIVSGSPDRCLDDVLPGPAFCY